MSDAREPAGGFGAAPGQRAGLEHRPPPPPPVGSRFFTVFGYFALAVVGMLAVSFVVVSLRFRRGTTTGEAKNTLGQIGKDAVVAFENNGELCPTTSFVPASLDPIHGRKYQSEKKDWEDAGWQCLGFEMTAPQYYRYRYERAGDAITITALGDLDGDGDLAKFVLHGKVDAKRHMLVLEPNIDETNPEE